MIRTEVLVMGAGPAGATAALNLAPTHSVLMADCQEFSRVYDGVGESLAPAARRLLTDMGLIESFLNEGHLPCYGNRSIWGRQALTEADLIRDVDGHGWHLDRARFDSWLRNIALDRGARLLSPVRLTSVTLDPIGKWWTTSLSTASGGIIPVCARILIDATGKFAPVGRRLGAHQQSSEELMVCAWIHGTVSRETAATAGFTFLEAVENGWWYTAPTPQGRRILAFHTDSDFPTLRLLRSTEVFMEQTKHAPVLRSTLGECGFSTCGKVRLTVASGGTTWPPAGPRWFAAGDAAVHFDPLSSQGLLNALFTGLAAAEAADRVLEGEDPESVAENYRCVIRGITEAYLAHRQYWYSQENRWLDAPFWARRNQKAHSGRSAKIPGPSGHFSHL